MRRSVKLKLNIWLVIIAAALVLLAVAGIVLKTMGFRYIIADNGTKFYGKTSNGIVVSGKLIYPDGSKAEIDRTAGTIIYENGDSYYGEFSGCYRHGNGVYTFAGGDVYEGEFVNDVIEGKGRLKTVFGDTYDGSFVNGKKEIGRAHV